MTKNRAAKSTPALDDLCRLAEDLWPGCVAQVIAPADPLVEPFSPSGATAWADGERFCLGADLGPPSNARLVVSGLTAQPSSADLARLSRLCRLAQPAHDPSGEEGLKAVAKFIASIPVAVMITDRALRLIAASPRFMADIGVSETDIGGRSLYEIAPNQFGRYRQFYDRCMAGETFKSPRQLWVHDDGRREWLRTELTPWRDADGVIGGLISVAVDITDMVEALERVERSEQRLQMAVELADLHIWELDYATGKVETSGVASTFFDEPPDPDKIAADTNDTIHPEDRAKIADEWRAAVLADRPYRPEYRINRKDDKEVWAACQTKLIRSPTGEPLGLLGAMQNITDRKQVEKALVQARDEAEAANDAKSLFLATISHEIRTPLNGVLGMAQAMAADPLDDRQRSRLETIRQSGETLLSILNDVLDLSKIEAGKLELELQPFDLTPLVEGVQAAFAAVAAQKSVSFVLDVDAKAAGAYRGDATRLRQILFNLVSNALKFTEAGEVRVRVSRRGGSLIFRVTDTGIGIPADRLPKLFNKFEQMDASTTRRFGGTGLGLSIIRDLAALMGGAITASSTVGKGSVFTARLPLERLGDERSLTPMSVGAGPVAGATSLRLLAAEDNSVNQMVLRALLQQAGVEPTIVNDGAQAVEAWRTADWDVVLMDVQMPVMDGPAAVRAIRQAESLSGRPRTPILALTANAMSHQVAEYMAGGFDGVVAKPIRVEDLFGALEAALSDEAPDSVSQGRLAG